MSVTVHLYRVWIHGKVSQWEMWSYYSPKVRGKRHTLYIKQAKWDVSLYNLHLIVIHTARQLNYTVKQWKKPRWELEQSSDSLCALTLGPAVRRSMGTDAEAEADRAQNKPVWNSVANFFSFIFLPHNQKWLIGRVSHGNDNCDWLLQSILSRTHQKDVWRDRYA